MTRGRRLPHPLGIKLETDARDSTTTITVAVVPVVANGSHVEVE